MKRQTLFLIALFLSSLAFPSDYYSFSGLIRDAHTGKPLEEIDIFIKELQTGTITNNTGDFYLFLLPGKYEVTITGKGYKPEILIVDLTADLFCEILLYPKKQDSKPIEWFKLKLEDPESSIPQTVKSSKKA